jgi:predicted ester cyclase
MTTKQTVLDHYNRLNAGDIQGAAALMAEDCLNHAAIPEAQGRRGFVTIVEKMKTAFPDMRYAIEDAISSDDKVVLRMTMSGTHTGPF